MSRKAKRFYKETDVTAVDGGYAVTLDTRQLKTPGKLPLVTTQPIAALIAAEWDAQTDYIKPETMPVTRLLNVAIERTPDHRNSLIADARNYAGTDVLCYRSGDRALSDHQAEHWDPTLAWAKQAFGISLISTTGIIAIEQPQASLDRVADYARKLDTIPLTLMVHFTAVFGSAVLAIAAMEKHITARESLRLSRLDELYQIAMWGQDEEAQERALTIEVETLALANLI